MENVRREGAWAAFESRWRLAFDDAAMILGLAFALVFGGMTGMERGMASRVRIGGTEGSGMADASAGASHGSASRSEGKPK